MNLVDEIYKIISKDFPEIEDEGSLLYLLSGIRNIQTNIAVFEAVKYLQSSIIEMNDKISIISPELRMEEEKIKQMIKNLLEYNKVDLLQYKVGRDIGDFINHLPIYYEFNKKYINPFLRISKKYFEFNILSRVLLKFNKNYYKDYFIYLNSFTESSIETVLRMNVLIRGVGGCYGDEFYENRRKIKLDLLQRLRNIFQTFQSYNEIMLEVIDARTKYNKGLISKNKLLSYEYRKEQNFPFVVYGVNGIRHSKNEYRDMIYHSE